PHHDRAGVALSGLRLCPAQGLWYRGPPGAPGRARPLTDPPPLLRTRAPLRGARRPRARRMSLARRGLGQTGERLAQRLLEREGLSVRQTNYRCSAGEIDIIAQDGDCLVFVEVKTRRGDGFGLPEDAITAAKRRHLVAASETFLATLPVLPPTWRIDLVAVDLGHDGRLLRVERIENNLEA